MNAPTTALMESHSARSQSARNRAVEAIRKLDREGSEVTFSSVAKEAGVGRAFLYGHGELRAEIEGLREKTAGRGAGVRAAERTTEASLRNLLKSVRGENQALRSEVAALKEELALAHGDVRELRARRN